MEEQHESSNRTLNISESTDQAEVILGICEGEIEGLADGTKSFYINDTALKNSNGDSNFDYFTYELYPGSGADEKIEYFLGGASNPTTVSEELSYDIPVVRTTQSGDIDFIEVRLVIQQLMTVKTKTGKSWGGSVEVQIEYKPISSKEWKTIRADGKPYIISGKITAPTVQEFRIKVNRINESYDIRVTKKTKDGDNSSHYNMISWEGFQEGVTSAVEFPNTALSHIYWKYNNQITSLPSFYGIYKLMKVRVPSNYNPETREYIGEWDGTFKRAWTDNPAWCLYDFVMNDRYGVNAFSEVTLDKWDCYEAGQWCDELVNDGRGGLEPRYTCNLVQTEATNGREFAMYLAGLFNAVLVEEATGYLRLFVEKDEDAVFLFTPENVTEEGFSYGFTNPENRYNDIKVSFTNPEMNWDPDTRRVYNQEDIDKNGRVTYDFAAVGCIREGEAMRRAYYKMITSLTEKCTVTFTTNRQAQCLSNFDIILIADPVLGYSLPGRIKDVSEDRKTIYLRDSIYLEAGVPYKIQINVPEGIFESEINPLSGNGSLYEFTIKDSLPDNLPEAATFTISGSSRSGTPKPFRVVSVTESEGNPDMFSITALELNRNKWAASDNMNFEGMGDYSGLLNANEIPHLLDADFFITYDSVNLQTNIIISPTYDNKYPYYSGNLVVYSKALNEDTWTKRTVENGNTIIDHPAGEYQFIILPTSTTGVTPSFENAPIFTYYVEDTFDYPSNVKNLKVTRSVNGIQLSWEPIPDLDLYGYEVREGQDWATGEVVITDFAGTSTFIIINDSHTHHYMVCAKNYQGNYSQVPAYTSSAVYAPEDVANFFATTSQDRVRFDWEQVEGVDIEYEIRQGQNWSTAITIAKVKGNNATVLVPAQGNAVFCIKACSGAGLYSKNPKYARPDVELFSNRNVILRVDNSSEGFPGITYGFEPLSYVDQALVMKQEVTRAEHYFPVELNKVTRARNWLETEAFSYGSRLTWEDLHYRYTQTESHISWINSKELDSDGAIDLIIMKYRQPEDYNGLYGFPYNGYTHDIKGSIYPDIETNITYADSRITKGLVVQEDTKLKYSGLHLPDTFSLCFKMRTEETTEGNLNLITLIGDNGKYMKVFMGDKKLYLRCSDHKDITLDIKWASHLDFITIGVSQTENERILYFFADYGNYEKYQTLEVKPLGQFTTYYFNRKLGEPL